MVPGIDDRPAGCLFNPRCRFMFDRCISEAPALVAASDGRARCHTPLDDSGKPIRARVAA
jgi:dipeptide transport system ATP-binding protein